MATNNIRTSIHNDTYNDNIATGIIPDNGDIYRNITIRMMLSKIIHYIMLIPTTIMVTNSNGKTGVMTTLKKN